MGLIMNTYRDSVIPFTQFGGLTMSSEFPNFNGEENWIAIYIGEGGFTKQTSMPDGNNPPVTWKLPLKAGAISARNKLIGSGGISASGNLGYQILANLTGSGTILDALGTLIIDLIASITGEGTISNASMQAFLFALADLVAEGGITDADLLGVGELISALVGEGMIATTLIADGELSCDIKSYGDLSVEGLRDAIWQAAADRYADNSTMGGKLNAASVGGVDYQALANAILDAVLTGHDVNESVAKTLKDIKKKSNMIPGLY